MAKFNSTLIDADASPLLTNNLLLVAVGIWMRGMDKEGASYLGLDNLLRMTVPMSNDLKLGLNIPAYIPNKIVSSAGDVWNVEGAGKFVYAGKCWAKELNLVAYDTGLQYWVHLSYIEWAVHTMAVKMQEVGKPWQRSKKKLKIETIGGFEKVDWL